MRNNNRINYVCSLIVRDIEPHGILVDVCVIDCSCAFRLSYLTFISNSARAHTYQLVDVALKSEGDDIHTHISTLTVGLSYGVDF